LCATRRIFFGLDVFPCRGLNGMSRAPKNSRVSRRPSACRQVRIKNSKIRNADESELLPSSLYLLNLPQGAFSLERR
jgi:hypothetical protein